MHVVECSDQSITSIPNFGISPENQVQTNIAQDIACHVVSSRQEQRCRCGDGDQSGGCGPKRCVVESDAWPRRPELFVQSSSHAQGGKRHCSLYLPIHLRRNGNENPTQFPVRRLSVCSTRESFFLITRLHCTLP